MRAHLEAHQIVRDETVEHSAQEQLQLLLQWLLRAEQRVRRHHAGRDDRGYQGETIGWRRDVPIGEPGSVMRATRACEPVRDLSGDAIAGAKRIGAERLDVLSVDNGKACSAFHEVLPVVRCVQLAAERHSPSICVREGRRTKRDRRDNFQILHRPDVGYDDVLTREAIEEGASQWHGARIGARIRQLVEDVRATQTEPCGNLCRCPADSRCQEDELEASMNRKDPVAILEAMKRVDERPIEQGTSEDRAAVVGREAGGKDESQTPGRAHERECAFDEELIEVDVTLALQAIDARAAREIGNPGCGRPDI